MIDPYVYPNSNVLRNKFNIKDQVKANELEAEYSSFRIQQMHISPVKGSFDFIHLCAINRYIFQDIYAWAGDPRTIDIEKPEIALGGLSIEYSKAAAIKSSASEILDRMVKQKWEGLSIPETAKQLAEDMAALWKVHCFREGNTRTTVIFCSQFAESKGISLDGKIFEQNSSYMRKSLVAASAKFTDLGDMSKPEYLIRIIGDSIQHGQSLHHEKDLDKWKQEIREARKSQTKEQSTSIHERGTEDRSH